MQQKQKLEQTIQFKYRKVLSHLAVALNREGICWAVGGSQLLAAYGLVEEPRDIDLLIQEKHALQAEKTLLHIGEHKELPSKRPFRTKRFYQQRIEQIEVDVMSGFQIEHDEGIFMYPFDSSCIAFTQSVMGQELPFGHLEDWYILYSLMPGREHRITSIENYWFNQGAWHPERFQNFLSASLPQGVKERMLNLLQALEP